ncbi:MAG: hypothetical protein GY720_18245 [bacterium]|nr:hypothetical protein [bacterium]
MRDIPDQLAAYSELLDQAAPSLEELTRTPPRTPNPRMRLSAAWAVAATAVVVLVVVGGLAALSRRSTTTVPPSDTSSTATTTTLAPVTIDLVNPQAVSPAMFPEGGHAFAGPGAVTVVDGMYHMLSAAYGDGVAKVAYAVSDDGVVWSQGFNQPVLDLGEAPWAPLEIDHASPRSVIIDSAGVWQLYFQMSWYDREADKSRTNIGRAVAGAPGGPWTFDVEPILRPDPDKPWMGNQVSSPSVVATDDGLVMVFVGGGKDGGVVGLAQSSDGSIWDVRPGPVLAASAGWERDSISRVDLVTAPGGFAVFYTGDTSSRRGLAVSTDGLEWVPHPGNPLMTTVDVPRASVFDSEFVVTGSSVLAFIENGGVRSDREVVVLRINVDLERAIDALVGG